METAKQLKNRDITLYSVSVMTVNYQVLLGIDNSKTEMVRYLVQ